MINLSMIRATSQPLNYEDLILNALITQCNQCGSHPILLPILDRNHQITEYRLTCPVCKIQIVYQKDIGEKVPDIDLEQFFVNQFGKYKDEVDIPHYRFWPWVDIPMTMEGQVDDSSCWLWTRSASDAGYGYIHLNGRTQKTHRVSYALTHPSDPLNPDLFILHDCDVTGCVNPFHLRQGTKAANSHDMFARLGHPFAKIRPENVLEIRTAFQNGASCKLLAEEFHLSLRQMQAIKKGKKWRYLYDPSVSELPIRHRSSKSKRAHHSSIG